MSNNEYNESHITVLGDLEAIRNSAFMYLSTTPFYKLICELVQNSIDEGMAGRCSSVEVEYEEEGHKIRVKDNGYGIPLGSLLLVISKSNAGGKFHQSSEGSPYKRSFGKHGIGLKACNAVSDLFEIWSRRDGKEKYYKFSKGVQLDEYEKPYKGDTGTEVYLTPDESLLQDTNLNVETLLDTLELLSFLNPGFSIKFTMKSHGKISISKQYLVKEGGINNFFNFYVDKRKLKVFNRNPLIVNLTDKEWEYSAAVTFCNSTSDSNIGSFTNGFPTRNGGFHVSAIKSGVSRAITQYMKKYNSIPKSLEKMNISGSAINDYICGVVVLYHDKPIYDGQVKDKLMQQDFVQPVTSLVYEQFTKWAENNKKDMDKIVDWCIKVARAEWEARNLKAKQLGATSVKSSFGGDVNISKFTDSNERNPEIDEVFFVEGDSAGGTVIQARFEKFQSIFRLRGKSPNVFSDKSDKLSAELEAIVTIMECGIGAKKDISKLRFNKLIILADADDDGAHITALLLGFFYKYYPEIIDAGKLYIATPPLYRLTIPKSNVVLNVLNEKYFSFYLNELIRYNFNLIDNINKIIKNDEIYKAFVYGLLEYGILLENLNAQLGLDPNLLELIVLNYEDLRNNKYKAFKGFNVIERPNNTNNTYLKVFEFDYGLKHYGVNLDQNFYYNIYKPLYTILAKKVLLKNVYFQSKTNKNEVYKGTLYYYSKIFRNLMEDGKDLHIRRYKGLGEMEPEELQETVTNPETRTIVRVTMKDAAECDKTVEIFLGKNRLDEKKAYFEGTF